MDQSIKNFDRAIEQRMNEQQVPPPFGAWNRIAAELDALPVAGPAPVNSFIPKRAIASFIAGMLIMGSAVATGFWVNATMKQDKSLVSKSDAVKPSSFSIAGGNGINDGSPAKMKASSPISKLPQYLPFNNHTVAARPANAPVLLAANMPVAKNPDIAVNGNADVPAPVQAVNEPSAGVRETYYFPPVDILTPEKCKAQVAEPKIAKVEEAKVEDNKVTNDDDRPKADQKKFKPHRRRPGWAWGSINRM